MGANRALAHPARSADGRLTGFTAPSGPVSKARSGSKAGSTRKDSWALGVSQDPFVLGLKIEAKNSCRPCERLRAVNFQRKLQAQFRGFWSIRDRRIQDRPPQGDFYGDREFLHGLHDYELHSLTVLTLHAHLNFSVVSLARGSQRSANFKTGSFNWVLYVEMRNFYPPLGPSKVLEGIFA